MISASMMAASPLTLASHSGVEPSRFAALAIRARAKQQVHHIFIGLEHGPVQRRGAIGLRRIHIGVLLQEFLRSRRVAAHDRIRNFGGSSGKAHDRKQ